MNYTSIFRFVNVMATTQTENTQREETMSHTSKYPFQYNMLFSGYLDIKTYSLEYIFESQTLETTGQIKPNTKNEQVHNEAVCTRISKWPADRVARLTHCQPDQRQDQISHNTQFENNKDFAIAFHRAKMIFTQQLEKSKQWKYSVTDYENIKKLIDAAAIAECFHHSGFWIDWSIQIDYIRKSHRFCDYDCFPASKYPFYSPFFLAFLVNTDTIPFQTPRDVRLQCANVYNKDLDLLDAIYMHWLLDYFVNANIKILYRFNEINYGAGQKYNYALGYYAFDKIFDNKNFLTVMISLYNIEVLQHFVKNKFYNLLMRLTKFVIKRTHVDEYKLNENLYTCYYILVFSLFFVSDENKNYWDLSLNEVVDADYVYEYFTKNLNTKNDMQECVEGTKFSMFFKEVVLKKMLPLLWKITKQNKLDDKHIIFLQKVIDENAAKEYRAKPLYYRIEKASALDESAYRYEKAQLDIEFYRCFLQTVFEIMYANQIKMQLGQCSENKK